MYYTYTNVCAKHILQQRHRISIDLIDGHLKVHMENCIDDSFHTKKDARAKINV